MATHKGKSKEGNNDVNYDEDLDQIDFNNYKGMFYNDEPGNKFQDEKTGAHFEYHDMCRRLLRAQKELMHFNRPVVEYEDDSEDIDSVEELVKPSKTVVINQQNKNKNNLIKDIQEILKQNKNKESRNAAQILPQQGYGTTGVLYKDLKAPQNAEHKGFRQFSSQFNPQPLNKNTDPAPLSDYKPAPVIVERTVDSNTMNLRSKSTDKQRTQGIVQKNYMFQIVPLANHLNSIKKQNIKKRSFLDLYFRLFFTLNYRQKNIEKLLEEKAAKMLPPANIRTNQRMQTANTENGKKSVDYTRSRNIQITRSSKKSDGHEIYPQIYRTTINNQAQIAKQPSASKGYKISIGGEQMKKLKASLIGVEGVAYHSRNGIQINATAKEKSSSNRAQVHRGTFGSKKKVYVSSFLRQSVGIKKQI